MQKGCRKINTDNRGSALLTVIVVMVFISIIGTTLLYTTGLNFQIKQADYQNKQSFYKCEIVLDELKGRLCEDVSEAFEKAYKSTMSQYATLGAQQRQENYEKVFISVLEDKWKAGGERFLTDTADVRTEGLKLFISDPTDDSGDISGDADIKWEGIGLEGGDRVFTNTMDKNDTYETDEGSVTVTTKLYVLCGIKVSFVTDDGYSSYIKTDIGIRPPAYDFTGGSGEAAEAAEPVRMSDNIIYMNWSRY